MNEGTMNEMRVNEQTDKPSHQAARWSTAAQLNTGIESNDSGKIEK